MIGNTKLLEYGIQTEESDLRAHVCIVAKRVYIYETKSGQQIITAKSYRLADTKTQGIVTAKGYLVPPGDIPGVRCIEIPEEWLSHNMLKINVFDAPGVKGDRAALIVKGLLVTNKFPLFAGKAELVSRHILQIKGVDIQVSINIQVKCDYNGGPKEHGGTGNLFLQVAECNPFRQYGDLAKKPDVA